MSWRRDLYANASRRGVKGALIGWFLNPGFAVVTLYRVMRHAYLRGGPFWRLVEKLVWRRIVFGYGCYIDPSATIGPGLRLPHPVGIVIGADTVIGADVTVYQNVTFGRRAANEAVYPIIQDGTIIYAGAIVTGEITVGHDATIAAGALVRHDVPPHGVALPASGAIRPGKLHAAP